MSTVDRVRIEIEELEPKLIAAKLKVAAAQGELAGVYAQRRVFQDMCDHPNGYKTSCMGDTGFHCPDCKHSR